MTAPKELRHNYMAPNRQNRLCAYRSAWEVMRKHEDFRKGEGKEIILSKRTRSIQRTQPPSRLWTLTLSCDLDLKSRSNRLFVIRCPSCDYCTLVPCRYDVCECNSLRHMTISSFFVTFTLRLWPSSSVKVTFIFIIRWTLYCCVLVPSAKFVGSIEFEIISWTIVWRKIK